MKYLLHILIFTMSGMLYGQTVEFAQSKSLMIYRPIYIAIDSNFASFNFQNKLINTKLHEALRYGRKSSGNAAVGTVVGLGGGVLGVLGILHKEKFKYGQNRDFTKPILFSLMAVPIIISIPLFIQSSRNNHKMYKGIKEAGIMLD